MRLFSSLVLYYYGDTLDRLGYPPAVGQEALDTGRIFERWRCALVYCERASVCLRCLLLGSGHWTLGGCLSGGVVGFVRCVRGVRLFA